MSRKWLSAQGMFVPVFLNCVHLLAMPLEVEGRSVQKKKSFLLDDWRSGLIPIQSENKGISQEEIGPQL